MSDPKREIAAKGYDLPGYDVSGHVWHGGTNIPATVCVGRVQYMGEDGFVIYRPHKGDRIFVTPSEAVTVANALLGGK